MLRSLLSIIDSEAVRASWTEWGYVLKRVVAGGLLPAVGVFAVLVFTSWRYGELSADDRERWLADTSKPYVWRAYDGLEFIDTKLRQVRHRKPDILMIGTSRALQWRSRMFSPYSFYNLGLTAWTFDNFVEILGEVSRDGYAPKVLFFNFDFFMLNENWEKLWEDRKFTSPYEVGWSDIAHRIRRAGRVVVNYPYQLISDRYDAFCDCLEYSLRAGPGTGGARTDGSAFYSGEIRAGAGDPHMADDVGMGSWPVGFGDRLSPQQKDKFEAFTRFARARGITLVAVTLPIIDPVAEAYKKHPQYGIVREFQSKEVSEWLDGLGVIHFDFTTFGRFSSSPHYFVDPLHPTELSILAAAAEMAKDKRLHGVLPLWDSQRLTDDVARFEAIRASLDCYGNEF